MPEAVKTNLSFFEVEVEFVEPNIRIWLDRIAVVEAIYSALRQWDITVDDIEVIQVGKPSEQGVKFKLPTKRASFFFGAASCRFNRDSTNWQTAEETIRIFDTALKAFLESSTTKLKTFNTAVALHLQPETKRCVDILTPLIPLRMATLDSEPAQGVAIIVKWPNHRVTIDNSAHIANGIFIRSERAFPADTEFEAMAKQIYADQVQIYSLLDIMGE